MVFLSFKRLLLIYVACEPAFKHVESDARPFAECIDYFELCIEVGNVVFYPGGIVCIPFAR